MNPEPVVFRLWLKYAEMVKITNPARFIPHLTKALLLLITSFVIDFEILLFSLTRMIPDKKKCTM